LTFPALWGQNRENVNHANQIHPLVRAKLGMRRAVREWLVCFAIAGAASLSLLKKWDDAGDIAVWFAFSGTIGGTVTWFIYRVLRFAIGS
jgi:hypothetical protein